MGDHNWISTNVYSDILPDTIRGGHDSDGQPIFVGRAYHNGELLPAKVIPGRQEAYICYDGQEISKHDIELLCGHNYGWVHCHGGEVAPAAVSCGKTSDGEPLFIGRGHWEGTVTPGKVHPSHGCLYIPFAGTEQRVENYEVLVQQETWEASSPGSVPPAAVYAGHDADGSPIYIGRAYHSGDILPAKIIPSKGCAYVAWDGAEHTKYDYEALVGYGYSWIPSGGGHVPPNSVKVGTTSDGEPLYVGRCHHAGSLTPGKIHPSHGVCYIPFDGAEVSLPTYEVLVRD